MAKLVCARGSDLSKLSLSLRPVFNLSCKSVGEGKTRHDRLPPSPCCNVCPCAAAQLFIVCACRVNHGHAAEEDRRCEIAGENQRAKPGGKVETASDGS